MTLLSTVQASGARLQEQDKQQSAVAAWQQADDTEAEASGVVLREVEVELWENERKAFGVWRPTGGGVLDRPNWANSNGDPLQSKEDTRPLLGYAWTVCRTCCVRVVIDVS